MAINKKPGTGILPRIHAKYAATFEDAFVVLVEFGEQTFVHYTSQRPAKEQQDIFDVFALFRKSIVKELLS